MIQSIHLIHTFVSSILILSANLSMTLRGYFTSSFSTNGLYPYLISLQNSLDRFRITKLKNGLRYTWQPYSYHFIMSNVPRLQQNCVNEWHDINKTNILGIISANQGRATRLFSTAICKTSTRRAESIVEINEVLWLICYLTIFINHLKPSGNYTYRFL